MRTRSPSSLRLPLRLARELAGVSQAEAARHLRKTGAWLSLIELGRPGALITPEDRRRLESVYAQALAARRGVGEETRDEA